jgi:hypothetical protein
LEDYFQPKALNGLILAQKSALAEVVPLAEYNRPKACAWLAKNLLQEQD